MSNFLFLLKRMAFKLNIELNDKQLRLFEVYAGELIEQNKKYNLTRIVDPKEIVEKHFIDSITCVLLDCFQKAKKIIDIGSGAGLPGIPLKICKEDLEVYLLESVKKKVIFLQRIINILELKNIFIVHGRAEEYGQNNKYREKYDLVISRAVAKLNVLAEYCLPFVSLGGYFVAFKGPGAKEEMRNINAVKILGGEIVEVKELKLPASGERRNLVVIKKEKMTPLKYPRRPGIPQKRPLS